MPSRRQTPCAVSLSNLFRKFTAQDVAIMAAVGGAAKSLESLNVSKTKELKGVSTHPSVIFLYSSSHGGDRLRREILSLPSRRSTRNNGRNRVFSSPMHLPLQRSPSIRSQQLSCVRHSLNTLERQRTHT